MKQDTSLQAAYVLHYNAFRDTSFIVDLFTLTHGRLALVARGARGARSRTRALYQPFRPLLVSWTGQGELRTLTGIEDSGVALALDDRALACAYYVNELVLRLVGKEQPQPELFGHYVTSLAALAECHEPPVAKVADNDGQTSSARVPAAMEMCLRRFEVQLLEALGLLPDLANSAAGGKPIDPDLHYRFYPDKALSVPVTKPGQVRPTSAQGEAGGIESLSTQSDGMTLEESVAVQGSSLIAITRLDFSASTVLDDARQVMRRLLRLHLGGQPLKSRRLFEALVRHPRGTRSDNG